MGNRSSPTSDKDSLYQSHRYHYKADNVNGFVSILMNDKGTNVTQFSRTNNRPIPQEAIDKIRPIMDKIQIAIADSCKVSNFSALVSETCRKVKCD